MGKKQGIIKKVGPYEMDHSGVVIRRSGKGFRVPNMPEYFKTKPRFVADDGIVCGLRSCDIHEAFISQELRNIEEINALRENAWRRERYAELSAMRRLYCRQVADKICKRVEKICHKSGQMLDKLCQEYREYKR